MFEDYVFGKIFISQKQILRHDKINYDIFKDQLLVMRDGKEFTVSMNMITRFILVDVNEDSLYFTKLLGLDGKIGFFQKLNENGKLLKEFKNRKSFLEFFPEKESELEQFIKREKIDFKNATDLLRLFQYLDQLLTV